MVGDNLESARHLGAVGASPIMLETERLVLRYQQAADVTRHIGGPRDREWLRTELEEVA